MKMGYKCRIIGIACICLSIALLIGIILVVKRKENYSVKLFASFEKDDEVLVRDVFGFSFDRAYVFDDCYLSGEGFTQRYQLPLSIDQVQSGASENIQRIIFVDESGSFVYEFQCGKSEVLIAEKGLVIYPDTEMKRISEPSKTPLTILFQSEEHYGNVTVPSSMVRN